MGLDIPGMAQVSGLTDRQVARAYDKRGVDNVARKGQSVGSTLPLGYRTGPDKRLEPDPKTAPLVRRIFEIYTAGNAQKEIIEHLNAEGLG